MENPELLLLEIEEFNRMSSTQSVPIPQNLESFIEFVSKTGKHIFPWKLVKGLFQKKLVSVVNNLESSMSASDPDASTSSSYVLSQCNDANSAGAIKARIIERMNSFTSAPFTIQRMCELLIKPTSHYNRIDKYLRGLEKCIMVVTTVDPDGNKIFMDNSVAAANGLSPANNLLPSCTGILSTPIRPSTPPQLQTLEAANTSLPPETSPTRTEATSYTADSTALHITTVSVETSTASVGGVCASVTETVTSETDMVVSSGETVLQEPESNMDLHVKTTEVQMVTCTSRTEPLVETADLDNK